MASAIVPPPMNAMRFDRSGMERDPSGSVRRGRVRLGLRVRDPRR